VEKYCIINRHHEAYGSSGLAAECSRGRDRDDLEGLLVGHGCHLELLALGGGLIALLTLLWQENSLDVR